MGGLNLAFPSGPDGIIGVEPASVKVCVSSARSLVDPSARATYRLIDLAGTIIGRGENCMADDNDTNPPARKSDEGHCKSTHSSDAFEDPLKTSKETAEKPKRPSWPR